MHVYVFIYIMKYKGTIPVMTTIVDLKKWDGDENDNDHDDNNDDIDDGCDDDYYYYYH